MEIHQHRGRLARTLDRLSQGEVRVGFIGGSITDGRSGYSWPKTVMAWLVGHFPAVRFIEENAAIGATGSDLAVFRAQRDLIDRGCDLVFVEFAVNDGGVPTEKRRKTREGLIRKLLAGEGRDLVLVYTYAQTMYDDMFAGRVPASIAEFEELAEHYGLGSVWMGLAAFREVQAGLMRWEEWLPDGLHPRERGSLCYGQSVAEFLERELVARPSKKAIRTGDRMPPPLDPLHWQGAWCLALSEIKTQGPWLRRRSLNITWLDQILETAAVGAGLSLSFEGRGLYLGLDFGKNAAEFTWRMDGGEWTAKTMDRPAWCGESGWLRLIEVADALEPGRHTFELTVVHGNRPECTGTNFRLGLVGIVR